MCVVFYFIYLSTTDFVIAGGCDFCERGCVIPQFQLYVIKI